MARSWFAGTSNDIALRKGLGGALYLAGGTLKGWTAETGGTQHTDLLLAAAAVTEIPVPSTTGRIPRYQGPDDVNDGMWVSIDDGPRFWLDAAVKLAIGDTAPASPVLNDPWVDTT